MINSVPSDSSSCEDDITNRILQDILLLSKEGGTWLLTTIAKLTNILLSGKAPNYITQALFGAFVPILHKNDGRPRPVAVGCLYNRIACNIAAGHA